MREKSSLLAGDPSVPPGRLIPCLASMSSATLCDDCSECSYLSPELPFSFSSEDSTSDLSGGWGEELSHSPRTESIPFALPSCYQGWNAPAPSRGLASPGHWGACPLITLEHPPLNTTSSSVLCRNIQLSLSSGSFSVQTCFDLLILKQEQQQPP